MFFEIFIIILLLIAIILLVVNLQQNKTVSRSQDMLDQKVDLKVLREAMDNLKNTQQSATYELSKNVSELYTLMTKGRSGHQGQLGEVTLRMILESSGLKSGINFDEQKQIGTEKPDIVVHLPDNRKVVIDSKVSLNDYSMFLSADNDQSKDLAKKNHINSVKKHIKTLSSTEYRALYGNSSLDLVIMFMNVEGAYILACEDDLIKEALRNKIAIVGPTTLIAIIQIISRVWTNKQQSEDTVKVINQATSIYEAAVLVSESFNEFNDLYEKSNKKIEQAMQRSQNLVNKVDKMRKIGGLEPKRLTPENLRKTNDND
jgi:DNA recombination protein RmuC